MSPDLLPDFCPTALLIVDDDVALGQMLRWTFEDIGYAVQVAADCAEAKAQAAAASFDCALVDYFLPDGDGGTLSQTLAQMLPGMRIVLMSVDRAAAEAGMSRVAKTPATIAVVEKPVSLSRLHTLFGGEH